MVRAFFANCRPCAQAKGLAHTDEKTLPAGRGVHGHVDARPASNDLRRLSRPLDDKALLGALGLDPEAQRLVRPDREDLATAADAHAPRDHTARLQVHDLL